MPAKRKSIQKRKPVAPKKANSRAKKPNPRVEIQKSDTINVRRVKSDKKVELLKKSIKKVKAK